MDDQATTLNNEVVAWATAIYESAKPAAWRAHIALAAEMARSMPKENLWLLRPIQERLTYPFCVFWHVRAMMDREKVEGRRADWFFWLEDDVIPPEDCYAKLRAAADSESRPFVSALAYARVPPYGPAIISAKEMNGVLMRSQWEKAPVSGTHPADAVGMCACIIHRRLFDLVDEPWFEVQSPQSGYSGMGPDALWCYRLKQIGIQPHVCCDIEVGHVGDGVVANRALSETQ